MDKLVKWLIRVNRINMLMIVHHIALCTPCIVLFNCCPSFAYTGRSRGARNGDPKRSKSKEYSEVHKRQVARILT
jgi:hypothetical protein